MPPGAHATGLAVEVPDRFLKGLAADEPHGAKRSARKKCRAGRPKEVGAPETGIRRNRDLLTPQGKDLIPGT